MPNNPDSGTPETIEGQPTPKIEEGGASAELVAALQKALEPFQKDLEEVKSQTRALQSGKDRGVDEAKSLAKKVLEEWEEAKKSGMSKDDYLWRKEIEAKLAQTSPATKPVGTDDSSSALAVAKAIAEAANIPENDSDYIALTAKYMNDPKTMAKELSTLVVNRATKPNPTPAQSPAPSAPAVPGKTEEALVLEYRNKMLAARGKPDLLRSLKAEYAEKGVPVDQVIFY